MGSRLPAASKIKRKVKVLENKSISRAVPFDTSLAVNDLERWFTGTYALWSACVGGNWRLLGGYSRDEENAAMLKRILQRDWGINNLTEGISQVNQLAAKQVHHNPAVDAWDYCRGMQLLGNFYVTGLLDRAQMTHYSCTLGKQMQQQYKSWDELCQSYLAGFEHWCLQNFSPVDAEKRIAGRRAQYETFRKMKDGPYRLPWNMDLNPDAVAGRDENWFEAWLKQEELWIRDYRKKAGRTLRILWPSVIAVLAAFMTVGGFISGERGIYALGFSIFGAVIGVLVMLPVHWLTTHLLKKGRISKVIRKATKVLGMDDRERERLGMEMLSALQDSRCSMDYQDQGPHAQTTPARLLVSQDYFYQAGSRMNIILIRRSDVDYIEVGQEHQTQNISTRTVQSVILYCVYFYYRSSRERRLETDQAPDNAMGFFAPAQRDRAYAMIDRQLRRIQ